MANDCTELIAGWTIDPILIQIQEFLLNQNYHSYKSFKIQNCIYGELMGAMRIEWAKAIFCARGEREREKKKWWKNGRLEKSTGDDSKPNEQLEQSPKKERNK